MSKPHFAQRTSTKGFWLLKSWEHVYRIQSPAHQSPCKAGRPPTATSQDSRKDCDKQGESQSPVCGVGRGVSVLGSLILGFGGRGSPPCHSPTCPSPQVKPPSIKPGCSSLYSSPTQLLTPLPRPYLAVIPSQPGAATANQKAGLLLGAGGTRGGADWPKLKSPASARAVDAQ